MKNGRMIECSHHFHKCSKCSLGEAGGGWRGKGRSPGVKDSVMFFQYQMNGDGVFWGWWTENSSYLSKYVMGRGERGSDNRDSIFSK